MILKVPKIHEFLRFLKLSFKIRKILIITFITVKFQQKISVMSTKDSLTRQQFSCFSGIISS